MGIGSSRVPDDDGALAVPPAQAPLREDVRPLLSGAAARWLQHALPLAVQRYIYEQLSSAQKPPMRVPVTEEDFTVSVPATEAAPTAEIPCRLFEPRDCPRPGPLVYAVHGGGFMVGSINSHAPTWRWLAAETGFRVLAVDYRLAPEHRYPCACDDTYAVYAFICANRERFGLDAARPQIITTGDSAGGTLVLGLAGRVRDAIRARDAPVSDVATSSIGVGAAAMPAAPAASAAATSGGAAVQAAPVSLVLPAFTAAFYPATDVREPVRRASERQWGYEYGLSLAQLAYFVGGYVAPTPEGRAAVRGHKLMYPILETDGTGLPPTLVIPAQCDPLHDEGVEYVAVMRERGAPAEAMQLLVAAGHVHGFIKQLTECPGAREVVGEVARRMIAAVRGEHVSAAPLASTAAPSAECDPGASSPAAAASLGATEPRAAAETA